MWQDSLDDLKIYVLKCGFGYSRCGVGPELLSVFSLAPRGSCPSGSCGPGLHRYPRRSGLVPRGSLSAEGVGGDTARPLALQSSSLWCSLLGI